MTQLPFEDLPETASPERFAEFYELYPLKVKRPRARTAYLKALKLAPHEMIMQGVRNYIEAKPDYCDWAHPSTWLNDCRWLDELYVCKPAETPESLAIKAAYVLKPYYDGRYSRDVLEQCVREGLLTVEQMEAKL